MYELRGIEVSIDGPDKFVKLIVRVGHSDIYRTARQKTALPVNRGTIRAMAAGAFGQGAAELVWPHHIEAVDI